MGLIRAVVKGTGGEPLAGVALALEHEETGERHGPIESDGSGAVRFRVDQGRYKVLASRLPDGTRLPFYPSILKLYPHTEAAEFVLQLEPGTSPADDGQLAGVEETPGPLKSQSSLPAY